MRSGASGSAEQVLELVDGPGPAVVVRGPAQAVPGELLLRVAGDRVQQAALVAPLGHADVDAGVALDGQPLLVDLLRLGREREQHLLRHAERGFVAVQLLEDPGGEAVVVELLDLVEDEPLPAHDPPPSHVEDLDGRLQVVLCDADDVEVLVAVGHHLLLGDGLLHRRQPVPHAGRPLVLLLVGGGSHLTIEALDDGVGVPVEEVDQLLDQRVVPGVVDLADARSRALLDVEEEARPAEPVVLVVLARRTGADGEAAQQQVERVPDGVGVGVRPEVADALALAAPDDHGPGPLLVQGDGQERVALVVPQAHVEPGTVLLDEAVLEHERLDLVAHLHPLDRGGRGHHLGGARMQPGRILEVAAHPRAQVRGLADVDDPALGVLELVGAGGVRDRAGGRSLHHTSEARGGAESGLRRMLAAMVVRLQSALPESYTAASAEELAARIEAAKASLGDRLYILGHHYQRDEVMRWADARGDSFRLSVLAKERPQADFIVFCGVHFMAESADILTDARPAGDPARPQRRVLDGRPGRHRLRRGGLGGAGGRRRHRGRRAHHLHELLGRR